MGKRICPSNRKNSLSGADAEQLGREFLISKGLQFVAKNFRTRRGEIDLIMLDNKVLVFVEVRFRSSISFGSAEESITAQKCHRLTAAGRPH
jgi:putative endonuclease